MYNNIWRSSILLLSWTTLMQICVGQEDFLTIYDDRCITNTPSATAMIYDFSGTKIPDNLVIQDVVEMKSLKEYDDAEIKGISDTCFKKNSAWRYALFDNLRTNNLIKDRRWEGFETIVTSKANAPMLFKLNGHTSLSFSLQTEGEANIFLCNREEINNANCYEIILQDQKIELEVCERGQIARYNGKMSSTCKKLMQKWSKRKITGESWSHFTIKMDKGIYLEDQGLNILSWNDNNFLSGYVYFYTTKIGFWKVHFFQYIYTQEKTTIESQYELTFPRGKNCLAMFAAMCQSCRLKFQIVIYHRWSSNEVLETFEIKGGEEWKEVKHTFNVNDEAKAYLYITTDHSRYQNPFWALNKIRSCNEQEARVLKPAYPNFWTQKCQLLNNGQIVKINDQKKTSALEKCTEKQFGENCLSCDIFFNGKECPKGKKYCYSSINGNADSQEKCYCSIGYEGQDCSKPCASGTYGHGCQKSCKNCQDGCRNDQISGKCDSGRCTRNYYNGEKCDQLMPLYEFRDLPIVEIRSTSCSLSIASFESRKGFSAKLPDYYKFQYRKEKTEDWMDVTRNPLKFYDSTKVVLSNLNPKSTYFVRVFGFESDEQLQLKHYSKIDTMVKKFTTTCEEVTQAQLNIEVFASSAKFWFSVNEILQAGPACTIRRTHCVLVKENCDVSQYSLSMSGVNYYYNNRFSLNKRDETYAANDLQPYKNYAVDVYKYDLKSKIFSMNFQTKESVPQAVQNINYREEGLSLSLTWSAPANTNGKLLYYNIHFHVTKRACKKPDEFAISIPATDEHDYSLQESLQPYADYFITITANNSAGFGPAAPALRITTKAADVVRQKEIPRFTSSTPDTNNVLLKFDEAPCEDMTGPIYITTTITSDIEPWCIEKKTLDQNTLIQGNLFIEELKPFCKYNVLIKFYRREESTEMETSINFETRESAPNRIKQWDLTSKGSTHLSFRWLPPDPPTGQLTEYRFSYCSSQYSGGTCSNTWDIQNFKPSPCKLWPHYHCHKLTFKKSKLIVYSIKMESKNMGCVDYSNPVTSKVYADDKKISEPPNDLSMIWTKENHLYVSWYHPNATNGVISRFILYVNHAPYEYPVGSEDNYLLVYHTTITSPLALPDDYVVTVTAVNLAGESKEALIKGPSPPPFPIYEDYISTISDKNFSISIAFNNFKEYKKTFQQFLYVLITECGICRDLATSYANDLVRHHESQYTVKSVESIKVQSWKAIIAYNKRTLKDRSDRTLSIGNNSISGNTKEDIIYDIKHNTTYSLAFIWIHKLGNYIRMNYTFVRIDIGTPPPPKPSFLTGVIIFLTFLLVVVIMLVFYIRWKREERKKAGGLLARNNTISNNEDSGGVEYENHQLQERVTINRLKPNRTSVALRHMPEVICPGNPLFKTNHSQRINHKLFRQYVKNALESNELSRQHSLFPHGPTRSWTYGALPQNKPKNRYSNLTAYNHSRVVLNKIEGDEHSDYINASYIDGFQVPRAYIATQGPKPNTIYDFWRMIWQEKVTYIVMMANVIEGGKKKVEQYWPNQNEKSVFGDFVITFVSSEVYAHFEYKKFQLKYQYSKPRQVCQLHFKAWPDHGVPLYPQSLVPILQKMLTFRTKDFPIVVHCSAGVGRTGTVILCDICLRMAAAEGFVDVLAMLEHLRNQRANMVDNTEQYKLTHLVILNCLAGLKTSISIEQNFAGKIEECFQADKIASQLQYIRECEWEDDSMKPTSFMDDEEMPMVPEKDRVSQIIPDNTVRVFLHPYPNSDSTPCSTYINAVHVDAFCEQRRFIVTQFPLPNTLGDFWRLITEKNISVVVCLNDIPLDDESCPLFFPLKLNEFRPVETIIVRHVKKKNVQVYTILTFEVMVHNSYQEPKMTTVEIIKFRGWKASQILPDDYMDFITFVEDATNVARNSLPALITCYDGATASGLFIAMSFLMEKIKLEQTCDVCQAVRSIRTSRKQFTNNEEQLQFLYKAALLYVEDKFTQYSNMNIQ